MIRIHRGITNIVCCVSSPSHCRMTTVSISAYALQSLLLCTTVPSPLDIGIYEKFGRAAELHFLIAGTTPYLLCNARLRCNVSYRDAPLHVLQHLENSVNYLENTFRTMDIG